MRHIEAAAIPAMALMLLAGLALDAQARGISLSSGRVRSIVAAYSWTGYSNSPVRNERVVVMQDNGKWSRRIFFRDGEEVSIRKPLEGERVRPEIARIVSFMGKGAPAMGLYTCEERSDDYPRYDIRIGLTGGGAIRLKSTSNCPKAIPWNMTDGKRLFVIHDTALPEALFALLGKNTDRGAGPETSLPPVTGGKPVTFDRLFAALSTELHRLLVGNDGSSLWTDIQTGLLVSALTWMDSGRFRRSLERLARSPRTAEKVRRHAFGLIERVIQYKDPTALSPPREDKLHQR